MESEIEMQSGLMPTTVSPLEVCVKPSMGSLCHLELEKK